MSRPSGSGGYNKPKNGSRTSAATKGDRDQEDDHETQFSFIRNSNEQLYGQQQASTSSSGLDEQQQCIRIVQQPSNMVDPQKELALFWQKQQARIDGMDNDAIRESHRNSELPLARIRRIMRIDDDVRAMMISAEVPALVARACEMFLEELTLRAWLHADDNKRKTLQRSDMALGISKNEMYDFLIDIVPREEATRSQTFHNTAVGAPRRPNTQFADAGEFTVQLSGDNSNGGGGQPLILQVANGSNGEAVSIDSSQIVHLAGAHTLGEPITIDGGDGQQLQVIQMPATSESSSTSFSGGGGGGQPMQIVLPNGQTAQLLNWGAQS